MRHPSPLGDLGAARVEVALADEREKCLDDGFAVALPPEGPTVDVSVERADVVRIGHHLHVNRVSPIRFGTIVTHAADMLNEPATPHPSDDADRVILDRVRKLFDKAAGTTNAHEADAFARKAAELVARHRIDPERLAGSRDDDQVVIRELSLGRGAYVRARLGLLTVVGDHHEVRVVFKTMPTGMVAYLAGFRSDVDLVELLFQSLHQQAAAQMATISRGTPAATQRFRRSFMMGFADRIGTVLDESAASGRGGPADGGGRVDRTRAAGAVAAGRRSSAAVVRADPFGAACQRRRCIGLERGCGSRRARRCRPGAAVRAAGDRTGMTRPVAPSCDVRGDVGRTAVYAAELAAFDGTDLESPVSFERLERAIHSLTAGVWWPGPPVVVTRARSGAASSAASTGPRSATVEIRLADGQLTVATAAHELAHTLAGVGHGHDGSFRRACLDVVAVLTNLDPLDRRGELHVDQLARAFAASNLSVGERMWPAPEGRITGAIAL